MSNRDRNAHRAARARARAGKTPAIVRAAVVRAAHDAPAELALRAESERIDRAMRRGPDGRSEAIREIAPAPARPPVCEDRCVPGVHRVPRGLRTWLIRPRNQTRPRRLWDRLSGLGMQLRAELARRRAVLSELAAIGRDARAEQDLVTAARAIEAAVEHQAAVARAAELARACDPPRD